MRSWGTEMNTWQKSSDVKNIARNSRITLFSSDERGYVIDFLSSIITTRGWLQTAFNKASVNGTYNGDFENEPNFALVKMLNVAGRDLKKYPPSEDEFNTINVFINDMGDARQLGISPTFGGVIGSSYIEVEAT